MAVRCLWYDMEEDGVFVRSGVVVERGKGKARSG